MTKHYTAIIKISSTDEKVIQQVTRSYPNTTQSTPQPSDRRVIEVASIVVRATSLSTLVKKTQAHLDLVVDEDDDDEI